MIPAPFQYFAPKTVNEAIGLLQQHGDDAKLLAGGHSLLPALKLRLAQPAVLIDISRVSELKGITSNGDRLVIGAGATYHEIATSEAVRSGCLALAECVGQIGDIQVRNRGTIGGSLAHADPAADLPAVVLALGATINVMGPNGARSIAADDMFVAMMTTALSPDEVITSVTFPHPGQGVKAQHTPNCGNRRRATLSSAWRRMSNSTAGDCRCVPHRRHRRWRSCSTPASRRSGAGRRLWR
jgi:carbon-monoxide dehydrogenase medium subunit